MDAQDLALKVTRSPSAAGFFSRSGREYRTNMNADKLSNSAIAATGNNAGSNPVFKTGACKNFLSTGTCRFGDKCIFAHGPQDHRKSRMMNQNTVKRQPCRFSWKLCPYGKNCMFVHEGSETYGEKGDMPWNCLKKYKSVIMQPVYVDSKRPSNNRAMLNACNYSSKCNDSRGQAELRSFAPNLAPESRNARIATMTLVKDFVPKHSRTPTASENKLSPRACLFKQNWNKKVVGIYADWINEEPFSVW